MQAMILAAGFGTRLLPYTKIRPKPLFPLLNEPLLLLTIRRLKVSGFDRIIVNCHYLKEQIVEAVSGIPGVTVQEEDTVLGTGGGLRMALSQLHDEPLLVTNGDIYHSIDYAELYREHLANHSTVTMAMHDYPRFNKVCEAGGFVTGFGGMKKSGTLLAFTGLHVLEPWVLESIPPDLEYSIIDRYRDLLEVKGETISAYRVDGCTWTDMGTVEDYLGLHGRLLKKKVPLWPEFSAVLEGPVVMHPSGVRHSVLFEDWCCVGKVKMPEQATLRRCVVWDGAKIEEGAEHSDSLLA